MNRRCAHSPRILGGPMVFEDATLSPKCGLTIEGIVRQRMSSRLYWPNGILPALLFPDAEARVSFSGLNPVRSEIYCIAERAKVGAEAAWRQGKGMHRDGQATSCGSVR